MSLPTRITILCLSLFFGVLPLIGQQQAVVTITGSESHPSGGWNTGVVTLVINRTYTISVPYGEYSSKEGIASAFGGLLSEDTLSPVNAFANGSVLTLKARTASGGQITSLTGSSTGPSPFGITAPTPNTPSPTSTILTSNLLITRLGSEVLLNASIAPLGPSGSVTFYEVLPAGNNTLGSSPVVSGNASLSVSSLTVGAHVVGANYNGDTLFQGSIANSTVTIDTEKAIPLMELQLSPSTSSNGQQVTEKVIFDTGGSFAPTGPIQFISSLSLADESTYVNQGAANLSTVSTTNLLAYSNSPQGWTVNNPGNGTFGVTDDPAPDHSVAVSTLTFDGLSDTSVSQSIQPVALAVPYSFSVWLRYKTTGTQTLATNLSIEDQSGVLSTSQITLGAQWQRVDVSAVATASSQRIAGVIGGQDSLGNRSTPLSAGAIEIWGAQVEQTSSPGPYVSTTGAPATGIGAVASITTSSFTVIHAPSTLNFVQGSFPGDSNFTAALSASASPIQSPVNAPVSIENILTPLPVITSLSTPEGPVGSTVIIAGYNFGAPTTQAPYPITITFGGQPAPILSWTSGAGGNSSIAVTVPSGLTVNAQAPIVVQNSASYSSQQPTPFLVTPNPTIQQNQLYLGFTQQIAVQNIGSIQGSVTLNGTPLQIVNWYGDNSSPSGTTTINLVVPPNAVSGILVVTTVGGATSSKTVAMYLSAVTSPSQTVPVGSLVTWSIYGNSTATFGNTQGSITYIPNGASVGISLPIVVWAPNQVICQLVNIPIGFGYLTLTTSQGVSTNGFAEIGVDAPPVITSIDGEYAGSFGTIRGSDFTFGPGTIFLNGTQIPLTVPGLFVGEWSPTSITFPILPTYTSGNITITVVGGVSVTAPIDIGASLISSNPSSGSVGSQVVLTGTNFVANDSVIIQKAVLAGSITNYTYVPVPSTYIDSSHINVTVPSNLPNAAGLYYEFWQIKDSTGIMSNPLSFTVGPPPVLYSVVSPHALVGQPVKINGANLGTSGTLTFNGVPASNFPAPWTPSSITATVPVGATSGSMQVTSGSGATSNALPFTVDVGIASLLPQSGPVGTHVTISGGGFLAQPQVLVGTTPATSISSQPSQPGIIQAQIPNLADGAYPVTVSNPGGAPSAGVTFTVTDPPSITQPLGPAAGCEGSSTTIMGSNFGPYAGTVSINGVLVTNFFVGTSWANSTLTIQIPVGAATGLVVVTTPGGVSSTSNPVFTVLPCIKQLSPSAGPPGNPLIIRGTTFGATPGTISLGSATLSVAQGNWTPTAVTTSVPGSAATGSLVLTTSAGLPSAPISFTVGNNPTVSGITPPQGAAGDAIVISGGNFGPNQGTVSFTSGTQTMPATVTPGTWDGTNGTITVSVPSGMRVGASTVVVTNVTTSLMSSPYPFTIVPGITSLTLPSGPPQVGLQIIGTGFGTNPSVVSASLSSSGQPSLTILGASDTLLTVQIPATAILGSQSLTVTVNGIVSAGAPFQVVSPLPCPPQ